MSIDLIIHTFYIIRSISLAFLILGNHLASEISKLSGRGLRMGSSFSSRGAGGSKTSATCRRMRCS